MIGFFIKHKKVRGVITVFLTLIYLSVYALIGIFVDGGRVRMAKTVIEDVQQIATENIMSQYNRGLYEYYGLFGITDYAQEDIVKDVQKQIEESIGLKIPQDTVKTFIEDVWTGAHSAVNNSGILSKSKSIFENTKEYVGSIEEDIRDSHKRFDPYGVKIEKTDVSYIDLTNIEALRAQIRDEMRYTAPLVLGANFFDAINEFMSFGDCADAVSHVADILTNVDKNIDKKQQDYFTSLNNFSDKFHEYVEECYKPNVKLWGEMEIDKEIVDAVQKAKEILGSLLALSNPISAVNALWNFFNKGRKSSSGGEEQNKYIIKTDMHLGETGGFGDIILSEDPFTRLSKDFDNESGWPSGRKLDEEEWTDSEGNTHIRYYYGDISEADHRERASSKANSRKTDFQNAIQKIIDGKSKPAINAVDDSINKIEICMGAINDAEGMFLDGHNNNATSEESKGLYKNYMSTYLRQWNNLANQRKILLIIKGDLEELNKTLENAKSSADLDFVCNSIENIENYSMSWKKPTASSSKLKNYLYREKEKFNNIMKKLASSSGELDSMRELQDNANAEKLSTSVFDLLNTIVTNKEANEKDIEPKDAVFGKIKKHEKSENVIYDPTADVELKELDKDNIIAKIKEIMNKAKEIITALPENLAGNIYDETYILSHCRDYVHTHRYSQLSNDEKGKYHKNIDTVLNPKFVVDQSSTNYLTPQQFSDLQVTPAEIEYILWGNENTATNVTIMYANIFIIRLALNYIAIQVSPASSAEVNALSAAALVFAPGVKFAAPLIYALPQSIKETKQIMLDCQKVNVWNGGENLHLWSFFTDTMEETAEEITKEAKKAAEKIKSSAKKMLTDKNAVTTVLLSESVRANSPPTNILNVLNFLEGNALLSDILPEDVDKGDGAQIDNTIKAGYSDYLLIYLFLRGINKESQISNLQDVIETNMSKEMTGQPNFRLKNTYSQISVETDTTIKYIFMTQSFMGRTFSNAKGYNKYSIKTKTAFAY